MLGTAERRIGVRKWVPCVLAGVLLSSGASLAQRGTPKNTATFDRSHYRHASGIEFDVPDGWTYDGTEEGESVSDETAHWAGPRTASTCGTSLNVWMAPRNGPPENLADVLDSAIATKTAQRERQGYLQWHVRQESVARSVINGHQAMVAIADFETRVSKTPVVEYLTWLETPKTRALFFATMCADQLATFKPMLDRTVQSAKLP